MEPPKRWQSRLRDALGRKLGLNVFTAGSLPEGVDWARDVRRLASADGNGAPPRVFFDVGANVGQTVTAIRERFADAEVYAFEPFRAPLAALRARTAGWPGVRVFPLAMGATPGRVEIVARADSPQNSLLTPPPAGEEAPGQPAEIIEIDTLDAFCARENVGAIDVLKTDTEGYDVEVLRGAAGLLAAGRVRFVYVEVTLDAASRQNTPFFPVHELLSAHGFRFRGLYEQYPLHHYGEDLSFCNALFSRHRGVGGA